MICFHSCYNLGSDHKYNDKYEFLIDIIEENAKPSDIISYLIKNPNSEAKLSFNNHNKQYELLSYSEHWVKDWVCVYSTKSIVRNLEELAYNILQELSIKQLEEIVKDYVYILKLYLYDHSGITMSTGGFICSWDSSDIGYIYTTKEKAIDYFSDKNILETKIIPFLKKEVEYYDCYLRGEYYDIDMYEDDELIVQENIISDFEKMIDMLKEAYPNFIECLNKVTYDDIEY